MPDDENVGVEEQEIASPESTDQQTDSEPENQAQDSATEDVSDSPPKRSKEDNLRKMGQALDDLKRQNAELQNALVKFAPKPVEAAEPPDELAGLSDDDFVSVSQVKKLAERIVKQTVKSAMKEGRVERLEKEFKRDHSDYDAVVNQDNFEKLFKEMPEMRAVLAKAYDSAVKGDGDIDPAALSYKLLRNYAKNGDDNDMSKKASEEKLVKNQQKPLSAAAIKSSALTEAHKYMGGSAPSKEERARIYKETVEASKARR